MNTVNTTKPPKTKIPVKSIRIEQVEGLKDALIIATVVTFKAAGGVLARICETAPKDGSHLKTDFVVTFADGNTYAGRYDARHPSTISHEGTDLAGRIRSTLLFHAGLQCPKRMTDEKYQHGLTPDGIQKATTFLTCYELADVVTSAQAISHTVKHPDLSAPIDLSDQLAQLAKMTAQITRMLDDDAGILSRAENLTGAQLQSARAFELRKALVAIEKARAVK
jgi:hypothetical protein